MACLGKCHLYRSKKSGSKITKYGNGRKRCNTCNIFMKWEGSRCPCCNRLLRNRPKHIGPTNKSILESQIKRI